MLDGDRPRGQLQPGQGDYAPPTAVAPDAPTHLTATAGPEQATLKWSASDPTITGERLAPARSTPSARGPVAAPATGPRRVRGAARGPSVLGGGSVAAAVDRAQASRRVGP
jgi:hypothetical protein